MPELGAKESRSLPGEEMEGSQARAVSWGIPEEWTA